MWTASLSRGARPGWALGVLVTGEIHKSEFQKPTSNVVSCSLQNLAEDIPAGTSPSRMCYCKT